MTSDNPINKSLQAARDAAKQGNLDEAATLIERVLEKDRNNLTALDLGGFVRFFQKRYREAEQFCRQALEVRPGHAYALKGLGLCLAKQGHLEEGRQSLEKAIETRPDWFDPYWDLAVVLKEARLYDQAQKVLERGKDNIPSKTARFEKFEAQLRNLIKV